MEDAPSKSSELVNYLYSKFTDKKFIVTIDNVNNQYGGKLNKFIHNVKSGKFLLFIIDNEYLNSKKALYELASLSNIEKVYERIYLLILPEAKYFSNISLIDYHYYWGDMISNYSEKISKVTNPIYYNRLDSEIEFYVKVSQVVSNFSAFSNNYEIQKKYSNTVSEIYEKIEIKYNEDRVAYIAKKEIKYLNKCPLFPTNKLIGRDDLLAIIDKKLSVKNKILIHKGISGIGKSTIAKAYINSSLYSDQYTHIVWINILGDLQESFLHQISNKTIGFVYNKAYESYLSFSLLLSKMNQIEGNNLLVIDNADNIEQLLEVIEDFNKLNWKIIFLSNSEINGISKIEFDSLKKEETTKLFYKHNRNKINNTILEYILNQIQHNTLLTEVISKISNQNERIRLTKFYEIIKKEDLKAVQLLHKINYRKFSRHEELLKEQKIFNYLLSLFDVTVLNENEKLYLRYLSILPPVDFHEDELIEIFQIETVDKAKTISILDSIVKKGWLQNNGNNYSIHSIIQEVIQKKLKPNSNNCSPILKTYIRYLSKSASQYSGQYDIDLFYAQYVLNSTGNTKLIVAQLAEKIGDFYQEIENYNKTLYYNLYALRIKEKVMNKNDLDLAKTYNNISIIYGNMGDLQKDIEYGKKALQIRQRMLKPDDLLLAQSYNNVAITYRELGDYKKSLRYHTKDINICTKFFGDNNKNVAISYYEISVTYYYLKDYKNAKNYIEKAISIWKKSYKEEHPDLQNALEIQKIIARRLTLN